MLRHYRRTAIKSGQNPGITLIEVLIAMAITALVATPAFFLYRNGVQSSVTGVISLDMLAEGKRITSQIYDDLKNAAIPYHGAFSVAFTDLLNVTIAGNGEINKAEFTLYRFAREPGMVQKSFSPTSMLLRPLISVRYSLEKNENSDLFKLVRIETARDNPDRIKVMSERVNLLRITPVQIKSGNDHESWLWNISLQLAHASENGSSKEILTTSNRGKGTVVMDFYDVVYPDFFTAINRDHLAARNWHTGLSYNPD